mgnify:CR=1 FL=1
MIEKIKNKKNGYLLVEILISMFIFSVLVFVISVFLKRMVIMEKAKKDSQKMYEKMYFSMDKIVLDIRNRDISLSYETSFLSELFPSLSLSENTISKLLTKIGMEYRYIHRFITNRVKLFEKKTQIIDGTLIDNNSKENSFSEFSRKAKTKGSKDLTLVYSFDIETKEPIAMRTYAGNMLDSTSITDFLNTFEIKKALLVLDKGFYTKDNIKEFNLIEELSYIVPLKNSSKLIKESNILNTLNKHLKGYDEMVLYEKIKLEENKFLYAFKNLKDEYEQKLSYIAFNDKNDNFDGDKYNEKNNTFGVIVFE